MNPCRCPLCAVLLLITLSAPHLVNAEVPASPQHQWHGTLDERAMLPVSSPSLSPGLVTPRALHLPGLPRLFLVGDDPQSLEWLALRGDQLRAMGAVGLAVQVADTEGLQRLRAAAPGLTLQPISGEDLAKRLGLQHYPVLITGQGLEQ